MKKVCVLKRDENTSKENQLYLDAIKKYGGDPILIDEDNIHQLKECDGILLTGGYTKGPLDDYLIRYALENKLPLLGICQGMQSMAMYNANIRLLPVTGHYTKEDPHPVYLEKSCLSNLLQTNKIYVNSYHHEQVKESNIFTIVGRSEDGVVEAVENKNHSFQVGVQWHPERMILYDDISNKIFEGFMRNIL